MLIWLGLIFFVPSLVSSCNWQQLQQLASEADLYHLCGHRTPDLATRYKEMLAQMSKEHVTPDDYVRRNVFGQLGGTSQQPIYLLKDLIINGNTIRVYLRGNKDQPWLKTPVISQEQYHTCTNQNFAIIMLNDFPYNEDKGILHLVIWFGQTWSKNESTALSRSILQYFVRSDYQALTYTNRQAHKSVPGVTHSQVFIRAKPRLSLQRHSLQTTY